MKTMTDLDKAMAPVAEARENMTLAIGEVKMNIIEAEEAKEVDMAGPAEMTTKVDRMAGGSVEEIILKGMTSLQLGTIKSKKMTRFLKYLRISNGEQITKTLMTLCLKTQLLFKWHGEIIHLRALPKKSHPKVSAWHSEIKKRNRNLREILGEEELIPKAPIEIKGKRLRVLEMISNRSHSLLGDSKPKQRMRNLKLSVGVKLPIKMSKRKN